MIAQKIKLTKITTTKQAMLDYNVIVKKRYVFCILL